MSAEERELHVRVQHHTAHDGFYRVVVECDDEVTDGLVIDPGGTQGLLSVTDAELLGHPLILAIRDQHLAGCHACAVWRADA